MTRDTLTLESGEIAAPATNEWGVRVFKGLPYAAPPIRALRWRAPQPVSPWAGVRATDRFGANSMQRVVFDDIDPTIDGISEDCLYLNIWTSAKAGDPPLPVMVWIHGGGFAVGSGSEARYDGSKLAASGVVVVTLNHRLNALGFLAHPELTEESGCGASGNYGLLDLIAALQWVRRNIAVFGGDPLAATIAGESAGSMAVSALMASPLAKGLFTRAIGESAALFPSPSRGIANLAEAEAKGREFARKLGAATLADLRALPAEAILDAAPGIGFWPIVDGYVLLRPPAEVFARGEQNDVALMAGWNKDEGFNFPIEMRPLADFARETFGPRANEALALYPAGDEAQEKASARALGGDLMIVHSAYAWLEAQKKNGRANIFAFRFDRAPLTPEGWFAEKSSADAGAFHAGELLYVFDNIGAFPWLYAPEDQKVAALTSGYWLNFIKTGDPNGADLPVWPSYRAPGAPLLGIDAEPKAAPDPFRARQEFLASVVAAGAKR